MYENLTVEEIKNEILSDISIDIDVREGSFTNDMVSAAAYEIWKVYQSLDSIIPIAFIDETSGEYIDKRCEEYGIPIKAGTKAITTLNLTGTNGTLIPAGTVFLTLDGLEFITDSSVIIASGTASITATAAEIGEQYNVAAGTITRQYVNLVGLSSVANTTATGGSNPETDASKVARFYNKLRKPATSGNVYHYGQWALEVDGVGKAKIDPLWNGPSSVHVLIVGNNNEPVDSTIVQNCANYIEEKRPIGAIVTVNSAEGLTINVAATISIDGSTTKETVKTLFQEALGYYLKSTAFETYSIIYNRIAYMLLDIKGVIDYTALTINGATDNIAIEDDQVPVLGTVVIT